MEGEDGDIGVSESEFVQSLNNRYEWLREQNHTGIKEGAEDFLELQHWADEKKGWVFDDLIKCRSKKVDTIASEEDWSNRAFDSIGESDGGFGIVRKIASNEGEVAAIEKLFKIARFGERATTSSWSKLDVFEGGEFGFKRAG